MLLSRVQESEKLPFSFRKWAILGIVSLFCLTVLGIGLVVIRIGIIVASGEILPGISSMGVSLDGMDVYTAAAQIAGAEATRSVTLVQGSRTWQLKASQVGIMVDAQATAEAAQAYGRHAGSLLRAMLGSVDISPVLVINQGALTQGLQAIESQVDIPVINATIHLTNKQIEPVQGVPGSRLDLKATADQFVQAATAGRDITTIHLIMTDVQPEVHAPQALIDEANTLLASPLTITAYDPISNEKIPWTLAPDQWSSWLTTTMSGSQTTFSIEHDPLASYLQSQPLTQKRFLNVDESVKAVQAALAADTPGATIRIYHSPTTYRVAAGDTLDGIAMQQGITNWQIQQANPGIDLSHLTPGQVLNIPSKDIMMPLPVVPNKRIVVSITHQHMTVYDNNTVKWDWTASTGIPDSPTMPGVYEIQDHIPDAHSTYLNMNMPDFMSIYDAQPGYTNGIHGFPTRDGVGVMWQNDLGHFITYGCVLLSTENAEALYNWAENGVIVEIQP